MPLLRLELYNFKSYRGKQVISLGDSPFVSIIGPNGAGKSNLMDAISFVLGVKSAQLRSTQLRDLIYRGRRAAQNDDESVDEETQTQTDPELGNDAKSAWVSAIYHDEKADKEWTFRRSISMSGASSYFLNNKSVAWKDYNARLAAFNILVKAKNFLVFQGDVEGVASQDSKALARLIDRISGSLDLAPAYEAAKSAQEKATEASTSNYSKKRSMLTEVKHFREQQEEVRQWDKLNDSKDALIQRHALWRLYHLTTTIEKLAESVEKENANLDECRDAAVAAQKELSDIKKEQTKAQLDVKKRESRVKQAERAYEDKKPELVALETQIAHSDKKATNATNLQERVKKDEKRQADSLKTLEKGLEQITKRMEEAGEQQRQRSQAAGITLSGDDLDQYRRLRSSANSQAVQERQQLETLRREQKTLRDSLASVEDKMQQARRQTEKLTEETNALEEREEIASTKIREMEAEQETISGQLSHAQSERERINKRETEINERLHNIYHELLQAGVDKRESEREAKLNETLASLKRVFPGVHGRVSKLCRPVATKYETAVMTVLGRNVDAVVVDNEKVAIDCIEYMRNQRAGQATFIPLDTIQVKPIPEKLRNFARGARLAIDCIEYDPVVERAMQHACSSSLICDTMEIARYVCYEKGQEVKAVTLEGTVIHKSGLITGGRGSRTGAKFDSVDVDKLKANKEKEMNNLKELHASKPNDKGDEMLLESLSRLNVEISIAKDELASIEVRLRGSREELKHALSSIKKLDPELKTKTRAVTSIEQRSSVLTDRIKEADNVVFGAFCDKIGVADINEYEDVQLRIANEANEAMEEFAAQQARVKHQIDFEVSQLKSTRERLVNLQKVVNKENTHAKELESKREGLEAELESLQEAIAKQQTKLDASNQAYQKVVAAVEATRDRARSAQKDLDKRLKKIAGWNDEATKCASDRHAVYRRCRLEEIDLPLVSGRLDKVPIEEPPKDEDIDMEDEEATQRPVQVEDYGIEPDFDMLEDDDKEDEADEVGREMEAQVAKMKADLERLAPNMKAVERLDEVEKELDETEREAEETRKESKRAKDEFQELKKKRCDLFNKAYNHMSSVIDKIYKDLTKSQHQVGGTAWFTLEEVEEPYLSGVNYNTMPPGKRFAEMEQLSGGEKTMAALALLFSIHSYHPAPFFVLDEVDAALDATNVMKLARYVRSQADKHVQFLIISLKSTLYEKADGLVGVYREQEENSSRTLTLDLRQYAS